MTEQDITERLREHPPKMDALADLFDAKFPNDPNPEVQTNLREWAALLREVASALITALEEREEARQDAALEHQANANLNAAHEWQKARAERAEARADANSEIIGKIEREWTERLAKVEAERDAARAETERAKDDAAEGWEQVEADQKMLEGNREGLRLYRDRAEQAEARVANITPYIKKAQRAEDERDALTTRAQVLQNERDRLREALGRLVETSEAIESALMVDTQRRQRDGGNAHGYIEAALSKMQAALTLAVALLSPPTATSGDER